MSKAFDMESVVNSYRWLGHRNVCTEVNAFHPMYRPGRENYRYNRKYRSFPVVRYVRNEGHLLNLVGKLNPTHMVCYGINPRPGVKRYASGHPRAHLDSEIEAVMNFFIDFDLAEGSDREDMAALELLLEEITGRLEDMGFRRPVKAFTGNGFHLLFALPETRVKDCRDIKERIMAFRENLLKGFEGKLAALTVKVDQTADLSRMAKVYGTAKPGKQLLSRFYGDGKRIEDRRLRHHLLAIDVSKGTCAGGIGLGGARELPRSFGRLLEEDKKVRTLWRGEGKRGGDLTRSGYDYSLLKECLARGITDVRELGAILALRPGGSVKNGRKGEQYIRVTVAKAIRDFHWGKT